MARRRWRRVAHGGWGLLREAHPQPLPQGWGTSVGMLGAVGQEAEGWGEGRGEGIGEVMVAMAAVKGVVRVAVRVAAGAILGVPEGGGV